MSSTQRDVQMLSKLADQYRDKGKGNPRENWADILKAHTLYNACASRSVHKKWREKAFEVSKIYWGDDVSSTLKEQIKIACDYQAELFKIRDECKEALSPVTDLINRWDCTTDNLNSAENRGVTLQLVKEMKTLSLIGNAKMKAFAGRVIQRSVDLHWKKVPCKFAAVALGSMAKGEATPYSDLEFMFLLEKKTPRIVEYFETLAMTVYFLIGNLQETKLKYMNIKELKNFKDEGKNGFKIDGLQSKAGNIPTGNGTVEQKNKFILTVGELMDKYQYIFLNPDPEESKKGDFTSMLAHTTVIYGESSLLTNFERRREMVAINKARCSAHNNMVKQDVQDYDFLPLDNLVMNNYRVDLKSAIYRFPSLLTYNMKIIYNIESKTSWETLEKLHQMKKLSQSFYVSLRFLLASALYIRMAAYIHHNSQNDAMTFVPSSKPWSKSHRWHITKPLYMHMSLHMIPLKQTVADSADPLHAVTKEIIYDTDVVSARVNYSAGNYGEAVKALETLTVTGFDELIILSDCYMNLHQWSKYQSLVNNAICYIQARPDNLFLTNHLTYFKCMSAEGHAQSGDLVSAEKGYEELLRKLPCHPYYGMEIYAHASNFYLMIGDEARSKYYYERAFAYLANIAPTSKIYANVNFSMSHNRADALCGMHQYAEAKPLVLKNIQFLRHMHGENGISIDLAHSYLLLGNIYGGLGQHKESLDYILKAEDLYNKINPDTEQSNVWVEHSFADAYQRLGNLDRAMEYYLKAMVHMTKYDKQNNPSVAEVKCKIGNVLTQLGVYNEAAKYLHESIAIYHSLNNSLYDKGLARCHLDYGELCLLQDQPAESLNHFYLATSFTCKTNDIDHTETLCLAWGRIAENLMYQGRYDDAVLIYEKAANLPALSTERYAMILYLLGLGYIESSTTKQVGEKMTARSKAHKSFVKALSLLTNSPVSEQNEFIIFFVAATIVINWQKWIPIYYEYLANGPRSEIP